MSSPETYPKRLIEVDLPIKRISAHARREKSIRHGHISTLHIWWARRPLAACRAVICAALWLDPAHPKCPQAFIQKAREQMLAWASHERQKLLSEESRKRFEKARKNSAFFEDVGELRGALLDFIADFANWDNSIIPEYVNTSRALTQAAHEALGGAPGTQPLVVDPFAGGGAIPLEASRVGADAFASDLNAVPVLLNKVLLQYVPRYGQQLADEVRRWGAWLKEQAQRELSKFYPKDEDGATPIAYLWSRTILSESPGQEGAPIEVPLLRSMLIAKRKDGDCVLRWVRNHKHQIKTEIAKIKYADGITRQVMQPAIEITKQRSSIGLDKPTSRGGAASCPITGFTTSVESVRRQLSERAGGSSDARLLCVVKSKSDVSGRSYRVATSSDLEAVQKATQELERRKSRPANHLPLVPGGKLNHLRGFFNVVLYGMSTWGDLFAPRQNLALTTLTHLVASISRQFEGPDDLRIAVQSVLALIVDRVAAQASTLSWWQPKGEFCVGTFGRQALPMVWDFVEISPLADASGNLDGALDWVVRVIEHESEAKYLAGTAAQFSATNIPLPDDSVAAVITDPPYYSAIPYADLSDYFYSWLARSLGNVHPDLFGEDRSPKDDECVSLSHRAAMYRYKDSKWFEEMMHRACLESRRITKPSGVGVFVFANKETSGWEAMLTALVSAGWTVTGSWPIDTERGVRMRAQNSAALGSSVHLVCRPRENSDGSMLGAEIGDWRDVLQELPRRIHEWMPRLAEEGVVGADAIFACIGPALEIFSRHSRVEKASGETVSLKEYLEQVWAAVSKEALAMIFTGADATGFEEDARLTAMWLWTLSRAASNGNSARTTEDEEPSGIEDDQSANARSKVGGFVLEYDAARKIAQGLGAHLEQLASLIEVKGSTARLLPVAERTRFLFHKAETTTPMGRGKAKKKSAQLSLGFVADLEEAEASGGWGETGAPYKGETVLDRVHQSMILFGAGRGEALKRFLVDDGAGRDDRFWRLAQAFSALYPSSTDEKRWVDGVLARKKSLGF
jgi:putative DNA methylase